MRSTLLNDLEGVLSSLERTQGEIESLLAGKTEALRLMRTDDLQRIAAREQELSQTLRSVLLKRSQVLQQARSAGVPAASLLELAGVIGKEARVPLLERIRQVQDQAGRIRRQNWTHWIIAHRCYSHYTDVLEIIANRGETAPTYTRGRPDTVVGGVLLDASA